MRSSSATNRPASPPSPTASRRSAAASRSPGFIGDAPARAPRDREGWPGVTLTASASATVPFLFLAFLAAAAVSLLLTPVIRRLAVRYGAIDRPGIRRVNTLPVPRGGGVAVAVAFIVVTIALLALNAVVRFVTVPSS